MLSPPSSTEGNIAASLGVLAAGGALGAFAGYSASPAPPTNKAIGAWEGGTLGVLAASFGGLAFCYWQPKWRRLGEMTGLIGVGAVAFTAFAGMKKASATPQLQPAPASMKRIVPVDPNASPKAFAANIGDNGSAVPMAIGDSLSITLPDWTSANPPSDWFIFTSSGSPASGYQGLTWNKTTHADSQGGGKTLTYVYDASSSLGPNVVQMVFQLLPIDSSGHAIAGAAALSTFNLFVGIA